MNGPGKVRTLLQHLQGKNMNIRVLCGAILFLGLLVTDRVNAVTPPDCQGANFPIYSTSGGSYVERAISTGHGNISGSGFGRAGIAFFSCTTWDGAYTVSLSGIRNIHPSVEVTAYKQSAMSSPPFYTEITTPTVLDSIGRYNVFFAYVVNLKMTPGSFVVIPYGTPLFSFSFTTSLGSTYNITVQSGRDINYVAEACSVNNNAPLDIDLDTSPSTKVTADIHTSLPRKTVSIPVRCTQNLDVQANIRINGSFVNNGSTSLLTSNNNAIGIGFLTDGTPAEAVTAGQLKIPAQITGGTGTVNLEAVAVKRGDTPASGGPFNASATLILTND